LVLWGAWQVHSGFDPTMASFSPAGIARAPVRSYGLKQEFITPRRPQQKGPVERVIRTLKEQCVPCRRFETQKQAMRIIADCIQVCYHRRHHQALDIKTPVEAYSLAA
jgi:putative transposase